MLADGCTDEGFISNKGPKDIATLIYNPFNKNSSILEVYG